MLSLLAQGNTGSEILSILDTLTSDNVSGFDYIESPMIESALGIPTLEEIAFWYNTLCVPCLTVGDAYVRLLFVCVFGSYMRRLFISSRRDAVIKKQTTLTYNSLLLASNISFIKNFRKYDSTQKPPQIHTESTLLEFLESGTRRLVDQISKDNE